MVVYFFDGSLGEIVAFRFPSRIVRRQLEIVAVIIIEHVCLGKFRVGNEREKRRWRIAVLQPGKDPSV